MMHSRPLNGSAWFYGVVRQLLAAMLLVLGASVDVFAQATATIRGTVVEALGNQPLDAVQVFIVGRGIAALTNSNGEFVLQRVPPGRVTVRTIRLGSAPAEQIVDVIADETKTIRFALTRTALNLSEIVVTGTGGAVEKRKVGNSFASLSAKEIAKVAPVSTFQELVQGRTAGVSLLPSGGMVGSGGSIRIRGLTSVTQGGDPLIYIDGVRLDVSSNGPNVGGQTPSRLTDLVTSDIERASRDREGRRRDDAVRNAGRERRDPNLHQTRSSWSTAANHRDRTGNRAARCQPHAGPAMDTVRGTHGIQST